MHPFAAIALDFVFAFALLCSLYVALAWGELCGVRPGGDKSGLGGFAFVALFALARGVALALGMLVVARDGELVWLWLGHAAIGLLAWRVFEAQVARLQRDRWAVTLVGLFVAAVLPVPAFTLVLVRGNDRWLVGGAATMQLVAAAVAVLHAVCFWQRRRGMLRVRRA
ncbi:MAG: hypothetical protein JNK15_11720 [Planctomycetes bacterium]|nr:hypothetical protein [Planctomycetota bacterium]